MEGNEENVRKNGGMLRPRLVTGITVGFMIVSTLVSSVAIVNSSINVKRIGDGNDVVKAMDEDPTAGWDLNKVWVYTDPDGNKVPVPIGFTASGAESERYVNHNVTKTGTSTNLTFSSSGDYAWTQNEDGIWVSGNYNVPSTTSELMSDEITVGQDGGYLTIEWSVSSYHVQSREDFLAITIENTDNGALETPYEISGTKYGTNYSTLSFTQYSKELEEGKYIITIRYTKDSMFDSGLDRGYVKNAKILNYDNVGSDTVNLHKNGGLVIYEGTENVNDENAWAESINRNQFVWVPVTDLNRIYETIEATGEKRSKLWAFNIDGSRTKLSINVNGGQVAGGQWPKRFEPYMYSYLPRIRNYINKGAQGYTRYEFHKEIQSEYFNTITSIEKYGGFYIGRYETIDLTMPTVTRLNNNSHLLEYSSRTSYYETRQFGWESGYLNIRNMNNNDNIQIDMIWGCLWDETMQWIIETGDKSVAEVVADSRSWGSYDDAEFFYTEDGITTCRKRKYTYHVDDGTQFGHTYKHTTGSTERNKANNIYDLAGGYREMTLELLGSNGDDHIVRGGAYYGNGETSAASRCGWTNSNAATRVFFYIK